MSPSRSMTFSTLPKGIVLTLFCIHLSLGGPEKKDPEWCENGRDSLWEENTCTTEYLCTFEETLQLPDERRATQQLAATFMLPFQRSGTRTI
mmetsp:Transcript_11413/g.42861  ORF Transcript_11413/g.42861 Transcript_11413/m.42861 type:complete len:92 (-) Transcript_11413:2407-2682(-)